MYWKWFSVIILVLLAGIATAQMTGTVTGTVTDADGNPLENAYVSVHDGDHHGGGGHGGGHGGGMMDDYEAWTDTDGAFTITEVETGDYEARAMLAGYGMDETDITVEANQTVTVDFVLEFGDHGGHHGGHGMHEWEEVSLAGWTIVVENDWHDFYYLDEENDGEADWHLGFGPPGHEPPGDIELPQYGDEITITGGQMMMGGWGNDLPMVMVFTLNGETWFEPDSMGGHHNGHGGDWHQDHDNCLFEQPTFQGAEGWVLVDDDADDHNRFWLDMDDDQQADLRLSYGLMEYSPDNEALRPSEGDWIELSGGWIEGCPEHPTLVVYEQNGLFWREPGDTTGLGAANLSVGESGGPVVPDNHLLVTAYPNPFNPETSLQISLPEQAKLRVSVFDVLGRKIETMDQGITDAGAHQLTLDASSWSSGVYFVQVQAGNAQRITKIQLMK